jgi:hypothetical protein
MADISVDVVMLLVRALALANNEVDGEKVIEDFFSTARSELQINDHISIKKFDGRFMLSMN